MATSTGANNEGAGAWMIYNMRRSGVWRRSHASTNGKESNTPTSRDCVPVNDTELNCMILNDSALNDLTFNDMKLNWFQWHSFQHQLLGQPQLHGPHSTTAISMTPSFLTPNPVPQFHDVKLPRSYALTSNPTIPNRLTLHGDAQVINAQFHDAQFFGTQFDGPRHPWRLS